MQGLGRQGTVALNKVNEKMKYRVLAVAHDAGGAEVLSSYLKKCRKNLSQLYCVLAGPARKIFLKKGFKRRIICPKLGRKIIAGGKIGRLFTSTSGKSDLERGFIEAAKKRRIRTVALLDHWANYRQRFGFPLPGWRKNLPEEIWVSDRLAFKLATKYFAKHSFIRQRLNYYLADLSREYLSLRTRRKQGECSVLFLSEPGSAGKERVLKLVNFLGRLRGHKCISLVIRLHPSEKKHDYAFLTRNMALRGGVRLILSDPYKNKLIEEIKKADIVIGAGSMALMVAHILKKVNVVCYADSLPFWFRGINMQFMRKDLKPLLSLKPLASVALKPGGSL